MRINPSRHARCGPVVHVIIARRNFSAPAGCQEYPAGAEESSAAPRGGHEMTIDELRDIVHTMGHAGARFRLNQHAAEVGDDAACKELLRRTRTALLGRSDGMGGSEGAFGAPARRESRTGGIALPLHRARAGAPTVRIGPRWARWSQETASLTSIASHASRQLAPDIHSQAPAQRWLPGSQSRKRRSSQ